MDKCFICNKNLDSFKRAHKTRRYLITHFGCDNCNIFVKKLIPSNSKNEFKYSIYSIEYIEKEIMLIIYENNFEIIYSNKLKLSFDHKDFNSELKKIFENLIFE